MKVKELLEYLSKSDPEATVYIETETHVLDINNITEDKMGINLVNETE